MIRVLRLLEYTFETNEQAEKHMSNFGVPANGTHYINGRDGVLKIRSAIIVDFDAKTAEVSSD